MLPIPLKNSTGVNLMNPLRIYVSNEYSKVRRWYKQPAAARLPACPHACHAWDRDPSSQPTETCLRPPWLACCMQEEAAAVEGDLKALERLRTMALQARAATEASVSTLLQYYAQVERLQGVFPIHPDGVRVAFTWHDAFRCVRAYRQTDATTAIFKAGPAFVTLRHSNARRPCKRGAHKHKHSPTKKASEIDLVFEKSAVLFNVGAVRSCMAASADRTSPDGMKLACQQFHLAAGVFKHLREKVVPQLKCALQSEMTPEGLQMAENIMLAQAQACFYEKAVADRAKSATMKASVIARLASQVGGKGERGGQEAEGCLRGCSSGTDTHT